jgi:hypothetical protein
LNSKLEIIQQIFTENPFEFKTRNYTRGSLGVVLAIVGKPLRSRIFNEGVFGKNLDLRYKRY